MTPKRHGPEEFLESGPLFGSGVETHGAPPPATPTETRGSALELLIVYAWAGRPVTRETAEAARAELFALRERLYELSPPLGSTAALYLLSAGETEPAPSKPLG